MSDIEAAGHLIDAGNEMLAEGDYDGAYRAYERVSQILPDAPIGYLNMAVCEQKKAIATGGAFAGRQNMEKALSLKRDPHLVNDLANILPFGVEVLEGINQDG